MFLLLSLDYWHISFHSSSYCATHTAEPVMPLGLSTKKARDSMETLSVTAEAEINKCSV